MPGYAEKEGFPKKKDETGLKRPDLDQERENTARSLFGILSPDMTLEKSREERLKELEEL